jgi:hypothetical protein
MLDGTTSGRFHSVYKNDHENGRMDRQADTSTSCITVFILCVMYVLRHEDGYCNCVLTHIGIASVTIIWLMAFPCLLKLEA